MLEATLDPVWIPSEILPGAFTIKNVKERILKTKRGDYTAYDLDLELNGTIYSFIAAFGDKNFLVNTISPKPDLWIGKKIGVHLNCQGFKGLTNE